jgi:hypothetical protein
MTEVQAAKELLGGRAAQGAELALRPGLLFILLFFLSS